MGLLRDSRGGAGVILRYRVSRHRWGLPFSTVRVMISKPGDARCVGDRVPGGVAVRLHLSGLLFLFSIVVI